MFKAIFQYNIIKYIFLRLRRKQIKLFLSGKSILMKLLIIFFGKKKFGDFRTNFNTETFFRDKDFFQVIWVCRQSKWYVRLKLV
jgi:hypothetical protein